MPLTSHSGRLGVCPKAKQRFPGEALPGETPPSQLPVARLLPGCFSGQGWGRSEKTQEEETCHFFLIAFVGRGELGSVHR